MALNVPSSVLRLEFNVQTFTRQNITKTAIVSCLKHETRENWELEEKRIKEATSCCVGWVYGHCLRFHDYGILQFQKHGNNFPPQFISNLFVEFLVPKQKISISCVLKLTVFLDTSQIQDTEYSFETVHDFEFPAKIILRKMKRSL